MRKDHMTRAQMKRAAMALSIKQIGYQELASDWGVPYLELGAFNPRHAWYCETVDQPHGWSDDDEASMLLSEAHRPDFEMVRR